MREVEIDPSTTRLEPKPTRPICISEQLYRRFVAHSKKYYKNPKSYKMILSNLLSFYDEHDKNDHWYNTDR